MNDTPQPARVDASRVVRLLRDLPPHHWLQRVMEPEDSLRTFQEEHADTVFGNTLIEAVESSGVSYEEIATALDMTPRQVRNLVHGRRKRMTFALLGALLWAVGLEPAYVVWQPIGSVVDGRLPRRLPMAVR